MAKTDKQIIMAVTERMSKRRSREYGQVQSGFTLAYAVSVTTGSCYVGYNMGSLGKSDTSGGLCAEDRALKVAESYDEKLEDLVFFALNVKSEFFNACSTCQGWLYKARGFMKNQSGSWIISTNRPDAFQGGWVAKPLTEAEQETLYGAGAGTISSESQAYFDTMSF